MASSHRSFVGSTTTDDGTGVPLADAEPTSEADGQPRRPNGKIPMAARLTWGVACGAGDGNRTRMTSLEGWSSAIELHPRLAVYRRMRTTWRASDLGSGVLGTK